MIRGGSSGTGLPGLSWTKGRNTVVVVLLSGSYWCNSNLRTHYFV